jgi:thiamine pyrophosphate-dependent acetolactate synthase large subunit-like protein
MDAPATTTPATAAEATVASLIAHGIDTLYALPGVHNDHLFDALFKSSGRIKAIHPRHEQGAAYMALGAALATGRPQAYAAVPGPGLLNTGAALLTAYAMNAPVLGLIGQIPEADIGRGLGHLHEIRDQAGIIARLVDFSARIRAPAEASALVAKAIAAMAAGRRGPAVLECAIDMWGRPGAGEDGAGAIVAPLPPAEPPIDDDAVLAAARIASSSIAGSTAGSGACSAPAPGRPHMSMAHSSTAGPRRPADMAATACAISPDASPGVLTRAEKSTSRAMIPAWSRISWRCPSPRPISASGICPISPSTGAFIA